MIDETMFKLFEDQLKPVKESIAFLRGGMNVLLYAPTAAGKTVMGSDIVKQVGLKTVFIVNKQILVSQSYEKLKAHGLNVSVLHNSITKTVDGDIMNDDVHNSDVIVTLIETLENSNIDFVPQLIVMDECHKSTSNSYQTYRDKYPEALLLGLTATPGRVKNKERESLGEWYDVMVIGDTITNLIQKGRLAKPVYKIQNEDADIIQTWKVLTKDDENKRTIVFAQNASHMVALRKSFQENGINAEYISSGSELSDVKDEIITLTNNQRNELFRKFREGSIDVLISWGVLCEGFDEPLAKYCFLARKVGTGNVPLLHQMIGRVLRSAPNKFEGIIVDFFGNINEFGPIEEYIWEMDGTGRKENVVVSNNSTVYYGHFVRKPKIFVVCDDCTHVYDIGKHDVCPCCCKKNTVNVTATFKQMKEFFLERIDQNAWKKFSAAALKNYKPDEIFWVFFDIVEKALKLNKTYDFNRMYVEIFEGGNFKKEYSWLSSLLQNKRKLKSDSRIEFEL